MITILALIIAILGCANWFLVGVFNFNLVAYLLPVWASTIVYVAVGIAGLWLIIHLIKDWSKMAHAGSNRQAKANY